jgi:hypothetical protein
MIDPDVWSYQGTYSSPPGEHLSVNVTRVVGLFIEEVNFTEVLGRLMPYPALPSSTIVPGVASKTFVISTFLVR